jgi:hypothetical protein
MYPIAPRYTDPMGPSIRPRPRYSRVKQSNPTATTATAATATTTVNAAIAAIAATTGDLCFIKW